MNNKIVFLDFVCLDFLKKKGKGEREGNMMIFYVSSVQRSFHIAPIIGAV